MEYKVSSKGSLQELAKEVQKSIDRGWLPQGGICITPPTLWTMEWYYQAMVKSRKLSPPLDM